MILKINFSNENPRLTNNFRLQMSTLDLIYKYKNNGNFSIELKMILALAFIKIDTQIEQGN